MEVFHSIRGLQNTLKNFDGIGSLTGPDNSMDYESMWVSSEYGQRHYTRLSQVRTPRIKLYTYCIDKRAIVALYAYSTSIMYDFSVSKEFFNHCTEFVFDRLVYLFTRSITVPAFCLKGRWYPKSSSVLLHRKYYEIFCVGKCFHYRHIFFQHMASWNPRNDFYSGNVYIGAVPFMFIFLSSRVL